ncbi:MAG TPA: DinB family protein [Acidimicrobiales bacterium]|nr:DinB family protein [Acidimicrobiales bacterium]
MSPAQPDGQDPKSDLRFYLRMARTAVVWKLEGLSEYDIRRPLVPSGTNLLGLVKHLAGMELGYLGEPFGRRFPEPLPWFEHGARPNADLWAAADETREAILGLYRRANEHCDVTIDNFPLDATVTIPWWGPDGSSTTLHRLLIHVIAETSRHAGHADLVRELIDGGIGLHPRNSNIWGQDDLPSHRARVEAAAREAAGRLPDP